jgi:hypothetical protein
MLRNVNLWFVTDVSRDRVGPIFNGQKYKKNDGGQHSRRSKASTTPWRRPKILLLPLTTVNCYSGLDTLMDNPISLLHVRIEIPTSL